jgi:endonuclease G
MTPASTSLTSISGRMKNLLILVCLFIVATGFSQKADTVVNMEIYKSYFSYDLKQPLYVTYKLYRGGGGCERKNENFNFRKCGVKTASDSDYSGSGLDKGHLANAEDFAYDCEKEEKTFCYFNCLPQTVKLNRGIWKTWEERIRALSQTKKLFVIAGGIYKNKTIGANDVGVPEYCYKIVVDARTKEILHCLLFPNDDSKKVTAISLAQLKKRLGYPLMP